MWQGDVQPYISLALRLIQSHNHRVRIATHPDFKDFVVGYNKRLTGKQAKDGTPLEGRLEYFDVGGDPKELMAYMVKSDLNCSLCDSSWLARIVRSRITTRLGESNEWRYLFEAEDDKDHAWWVLSVYVFSGSSIE